MLINDLSLYLITDRQQTCGRPLAEIVRQGLDGGIKTVQLREKDLSSLELFRLATELRRLTDDYDAKLIINDRADIAIAVAADGVHAGVNSMPVTHLRLILGKGKTIIYSAHSIDEALQAQANGTDFVTFGPVYYTASKAAFGHPCGVKKLAEAVSTLNVPVIGLGGISVSNLTETLESGVHGVAVISAVLSAAEPSKATASLLKKIEEHGQLS